MSIIDDVERRLQGRAIYQRGGVLIRPLTLDKPFRDAESTIARDAGGIVLATVNEHWLVEEMARVATSGEAHCQREASDH